MYQSSHRSQNSQVVAEPSLSPRRGGSLLSALNSPASLEAIPPPTPALVLPIPPPMDQEESGEWVWQEEDEEEEDEEENEQGGFTREIVPIVVSPRMPPPPVAAVEAEAPVSFSSLPPPPLPPVVLVPEASVGGSPSHSLPLAETAPSGPPLPAPEPGYRAHSGALASHCATCDSRLVCPRCETSGGDREHMTGRQYRRYVNRQFEDVCCLQ